ncbi:MULTISPECIES: DUF7302 family protein [Pseudomonas]|jgi:hypothetical protein|uniref:Uncharacterized protein n=3 Tax=Pseudomonas aeruginosa TaxID=287 RepID=A0A7W3UWA4_PSEAI|nr:MULTISPECIES: hypothetical protein [Pseudomonas]AID83539.1 prophage PssSM-03 [Pseudomonas aeruginosa VRFPA04]EOQ78022.1 hypothetical protein K652_25201 [Pseudomonas aeruginosa VRFPA02]DBA08245.1 TPA_asm: hypothetical protein [Pseudomonas phage vB_PaeS-D14B]ARG84969.1 hypothetical protein E613_08500 [Pseudomonas aeruginosa]ARG89004.1 hypothetical protein E613_49520 [Pseudomonas aeruginosa]
MKIKALWGFVGDAKKLGAESAQVRAGQVFEEVDDEYAHVLIGKGLAAEVGEQTKPKETKPAAPKGAK